MLVSAKEHTLCADTPRGEDRIRGCFKIEQQLQRAWVGKEDMSALALPGQLRGVTWCQGVVQLQRLLP